MATAETEQGLFSDPPREATVADLTEACAKLTELRKRIDARKKALKDLEEDADSIERMIIQQMQSNKLKSLNLGKQLGVFSVAEQKWFRLPNLSDPAKRADAIRWLKRIGAGEMIRPEINAQSLSALMRERLEAKQSVSPLIEVSNKQYLSVRKS